MTPLLVEVVFPRGLNWLAAYWLVASVTGLAFNAVNVLDSFRGFRSVRPREKGLRAAARGDLRVQIPMTVALVMLTAGGAVLVMASLRSGLHLSFTDTPSEVAVAVLGLGLITAPVAHAVLTWLGRRGILRALRPGQHQPQHTLAPVTTVIAVQNHSTLLTDAEVLAALPDFQAQLNRDFEPAWGRSAHISGLIPRDQQPAPDMWSIDLLDESDQPGALGYHDLGPNGLPAAKVFAKTAKDAGASWTVVFSHELLEMMADPFIDSTTFIDDGSGGGFLVPVEVGDPVEGDQFAYTVGATLCTDFVLPSWFVQGSAGPWDHAGHLQQPLYVLPGGYVSIAEVTLPDGWQQVFGDLAKGGEKRPGGPVADPA